MGPEFWEQWIARLRERRRLALLFYLQIAPPLAAVSGFWLALAAFVDPQAPDRSEMIAVGVLVCLAGVLGTGVVLYVRRLIKRFRSLEGDRKR